MSEPRSIKDIILDIAELPDNDYSEALRQLPIIQEGQKEREKEKSDPHKQ